ncbi:conserved hypothetical protein [Ricinus communis]|uniref:Small nuclear ribonucleoprotein Prp3 C-terminal domain-containing protein n=1 Tax=Ricinus communis TaxID=3988 RepID=B9T2C6_RICCO|nr:conserved hypothetical protein [Ricinus communis]
MDRSSSKRSRDDRDLREREREHKHRSRDKDGEPDSHRHHHHHHNHRSDREHHKSRREERESSRERELSKSERSYEPREQREREKLRVREVKREIKEEEENEEVSRRKRKERDGEDNDNKEAVSVVNESEKRARVSLSEQQEHKRERRRFGDKAKPQEEDDNYDIRIKEEVEQVNDNLASAGGGGDGTTAIGGIGTQNGPAQASFTKTSIMAENSMAYVYPLPTKVSSISNTNENKGVSVTRSHEVPGKSSTDGTSSAAGKSGTLPLDALAKAKKALQMQKELAEKLKKIPQLSKGANSSSDNKAPAVMKLQSSGIGVTQGSAPSKPFASVAVGALPSSSPANGVASVPGLASLPNIEAVKRAQELAAKIGFRQDPEFPPLINLFPGQVPAEVSVPQKPTKAPVLRIDALGREIDEHGNIVNLTKPSNLSTLKVNINKQKKDAFQLLKPELDVDPESNPHFDPRMGINKTKLLRPKRMTFQFVEEGKWSKDAEIIKIKNQFGEESAKDKKARQALHAKANVAPDINPNLIEVSERVIIKEKPKEPIPEIEWWDAPLLSGGTYNEIDDCNISDKLKMEKITIYIEHPRMNVVVVEGGSKSIKRYGKLMLRRINWAEAVEEEEEEDDDIEEKPVNKCVLVWQGSVAKSSFNKFSVHECVTEAAARKVFADAGVAHYWDLSVNFSDD